MGRSFAGLTPEISRIVGSLYYELVRSGFPTRTPEIMIVRIAIVGFIIAHTPEMTAMVGLPKTSLGLELLGINQ